MTKIRKKIHTSFWQIVSTTTRQEWIAMAVVFAAYMVVGQFSRYLFHGIQTYPAVILTPAGVALAGTILYGYRMLPAIALATLMNGLINSSPTVVLLFGMTGAVTQAFLGAFVLRRLKFYPELARLRDVLTLVGTAIVVSATLPSFSMFGRALIDVPQPTTFGFLWLGNLFSIVILTPLVVRFFSRAKEIESQEGNAGTFVLFMLLIIVNFVLFWTEHTRIFGFPVAIFQLAILGIMALRWGMTRMTYAIFLTTLLALTGPYFGLVHFAGEELSKKIAGIELYLLIFAIIFFILTAISEERDSAVEQREKNMNELENAMQKIKMEDQKKSDFIAVLAHELRNPLAPITNYLEIMSLEGIKETHHKEAVEGIERQIKNIKLLLRDLLDISRISRGKITLNKEKVDILLLLKNAVDSGRALVEDKKHTLVIDLPPSPVAIFADQLRIEQIILNLISNAAKYTPPKGKIWLSAGIEEGDAVIRVRDTGIGISEEALPTIFNMFNQADTSTAKTTEGLGVGLALVKMLTLLHGGSIHAKSEGIGKGSEFTLRIPVYDETRRTQSQDHETPYNMRGHDTPEHGGYAVDIEAVGVSKNILIVDDNPEMIRTLDKLLTLLGHNVVSAANGQDAIKKAHEFAPDTILLDLGLPGMSGYDVARTLRAEFPHPVTFIAVSGYGQKEDKIKSYNAGFDYHLTKPVTKADLEKII